MALSALLVLMGGNPLFDPSKLPGLTAYLVDPDQYASLSGSNVTAWASPVPGLPSFAPTGTPTYSATGWNSAKPAVNFSSGARLSATVASFTTATFMAVWQGSSGTTKKIAVGADSPATVHIGWDTTGRHAVYGQNTALLAGAGARAVQTGNWESAVGGTVRANGLSASATSISALTASTIIAVGADPNGSSPIDDYLAAMAAWPRSLSTHERELLEGWAFWKYGGFTLAAGHPFENRPPFTSDI